MRDLKAEYQLDRPTAETPALSLAAEREKPTFITLLQAAQNSAQHTESQRVLGIKDDNSASLQFHQLGLGKDTRQALLD